MTTPEESFVILCRQILALIKAHADEREFVETFVKLVNSPISKERMAEAQKELENPCYRRDVEEALKLLFPEGVPQPPRPAPPPPDGGLIGQPILGHDTARTQNF